MNGKGLGRTREQNKPTYLLDVCDVSEFNDFVPLGRPGSGAGALETQMTEETEESQRTPNDPTGFHKLTYEESKTCLLQQRI